LEIAVGSIGGEYFDLPLSFGVGGVAMRVDFGGEEVDAGWVSFGSQEEIARNSKY
jgi:hypothetical protein